MAADLKRAIEIAYEAHEGQTRLDGRPYVVHPLWVANALKMANRSETEQIIGVDHDVIECRPEKWSAASFKEEGYGPEVVVPLQVLTWDDENVSYDKYIGLVKEVEGARAAKIFDNLHNLIDYPLDREVDDWRRERILRYSRSILCLLSPADISGNKAAGDSDFLTQEVHAIVAMALDPQLPNKDELLIHRVARLI
jgi:hypothetical protein